MDSTTTQASAPANEMSQTLTQTSGTKRHMADDDWDPNKRRFTSENTVFSIENGPTRSRLMEMEEDDDHPVEPQSSLRTNSTSTANANDTGFTASQRPLSQDETLVKKFLKDAFMIFINNKVLQYGKARETLYHRQSMKRILEKHATNNTFPRDIDIVTKTGNPYAKDVEKRDEHLDFELKLMLKVKQDRLAHRLEVASSEIDRWTMICASFSDQSIFIKELRDDIPCTLKEEDIGEAVEAYKFALATKQRNMDQLHQKKDFKYQQHLQRKQKTTPVTASVNEQQFKKSLVDLLKEYIAKGQKKQVNNENAESSKQRRPKKTAKKANRKSGETAPAAKSSAQQQQQPSQQKSHTLPAQQQQQQQTSKYTRNNRQQPFNVNSTLQQQKPLSYADAARKPATGRTVIVEDTMTDNDDVDEDGFKTVRGKKNKKPKNVSATDPRNVPKFVRTQVQRR